MKKFSIFNFQFSNKGFTLLELIVVIAIVAILSGGGIAAYVQYSKAQQIQLASNAVASEMGVAKSRAQSQVQPPSGSGCSGSLVGYRVEIGYPQKYYLKAVCNSGGIESTATIDTQTLPPQVYFSGPIPMSFTFAVLTGAVTFSPQSISNTGVLLQNYNNNTTKTISVATSSGEVTFSGTSFNVSLAPAPTNGGGQSLPINTPPPGSTPTPTPSTGPLGFSPNPVCLSSNATICSPQVTSGTVTWAVQGATVNDFIALYSAGAPGAAYISKLSTSCSSTASSGYGSCSYGLPGNLPQGPYEVRYIINGNVNSPVLKGSFTIKN